MSVRLMSPNDSLAYGSRCHRCKERIEPMQQYVLLKRKKDESTSFGFGNGDFYAMLMDLWNSMVDVFKGEGKPRHLVRHVLCPGEPGDKDG